jgi:hypothetical protein
MSDPPEMIAPDGKGRGPTPHILKSTRNNCAAFSPCPLQQQRGSRGAVVAARRAGFVADAPRSTTVIHEGKT